MPVRWPELVSAGGVGPVDVVAGEPRRLLVSGGRAQLEPDGVLRVWDGGDFLIAKLSGDRVVAVSEPGTAAARWTVVVVDGPVAGPSVPEAVQMPAARPSR